jgi:uncharacterized membrane protein
MVTIITTCGFLVWNATLLHGGTTSTLSPMENQKRTWAKALTWQASGFVIMIAVNYLFLGSLQQSMGLSALLTGMGLITYVIHERLWARVRWGRGRVATWPTDTQ